MDIPTPETTSAEAFERYVGGKCLWVGDGDAWQSVKAWLVAPPRTTGIVSIPAVSEPFLAWTMSGVAEFQEREKGQPWVTHRLKRGSLFLTSGGESYDCRWKVLSDEPFLTIHAFLDLSLLRTALEEVFGLDAEHAKLRDLSAFTDPFLNSMMETMSAELQRKKASPLFVQGIAQAIAIHLARNYAELAHQPHRIHSSLPGHKLKQIIGWMEAHLTEDIDLEQLATQAGLSKFHFHRLFKAATEVSPWQYQTNLRMNEARRLLRESEESIVAVALEVGYSNPSHFARLFRRETGISPSEYRRRR